MMASNILFKKAAVSVFLISVTVIVGIETTRTSLAQVQDMLFPTYGSGAIQVRIYTDYFCPPCRTMEPALEPVLKDLIKKNTIRLTLVDAPFSRNTPMYAGYFFYALNAKNGIGHALRVRNTLFDAAIGKQFSTKENIEELFNSKRIAFTVFNAKPAFDRINVLIKDDNIHSTPTCVIIKDGQTEHFIGGEEIIKALKHIQ